MPFDLSSDLSLLFVFSVAVGVSGFDSVGFIVSVGVVFVGSTADGFASPFFVAVADDGVAVMVLEIDKKALKDLVIDIKGKGL